MIEKFNNLNISARLMVGTVVTALGLLLFAAQLTYQQFGNVTELRKAGDLVSLMPEVGQLVHELQKERGRSAGFISSKGASFADALPEQRVETDRVLKHTVDALDGFRFGRFEPSLEESVQQSRKMLAELAGVRNSVDGFSLTVPQMAKYYTGTIVALLEIAHELELASHNDQVSKSMISYYNFLFGKEYAGRERAMGAVGFGAGEFAPAIYDNLIRFIQSQNIYFGNFKNLASAELQALNDRVVSGPVVQEVDRMRQIAIDSLQTADMQGVTAQQWFAATTDRIDLMKKVEDALVVSMGQVVSGLIWSAWVALAINTLLTIIVLVLGGFMMLVVSRSITAPVASLTESMKELSEGNNDVQIDGAERKDELGVMARALQVFKDAAIDKIELEKDAEEQRLKAEQERKRISDQLAHAVEQVGTALGRLAEGDLTAHIGAELAAEYDKTKQDFNVAAARLHEALGAVASSAREIRSSTEAIAQASEDMSRRTESQAASLEETAAAVAQISQNMKATLGSATKAREIAEGAKDRATEGRKVVGSAIDSMQDIENAANKMNEIIGVIDEIAFQTSLLALNAGVEAARAGDAGKGFAVVASEVRALAQRSADESSQIKELISNSSSSIENGADLVRRTGTVLEAIVKEVGDVDEVVTDIFSGAEDQQTSIDEINSAINQLDQATQQNAAMAEQATAATRMLSDESDQLVDLIGQFVTDKSSTGPVAGGQHYPGQADDRQTALAG
ncbi:methyl-accepting chemotaxis protein [Hoeflea poritis]|uniref:Methyl-accepting chemotaxis protein n=1 Tax=Hoeflea poritis TaxID=2993659 RepID=A0ABT4VHY8_9HYPH|nr:methyl-accepting chemotaxis protein [Hoeflea poritis]MDA4844285.1 methyl-accepting chemotaxis protein [Hoeflea poritis]